MKSILSKLVLLITVCVLSATIFIGALAIVRFNSSMAASSDEILNLTCSENAKSINIMLNRMEKSVDILADYTITNLKSDILLTNSASLSDFERNLESLGISIAEDRDGAVGLFVRFNPEYSNETAGFYLVKNDEGVFERHDKTPLTNHAKDNLDWYKIPFVTGKSIWIQPYLDSTTGKMLITYATPMYKQFGTDEPIFLGIAGIDISFDYFTSLIDDIEIYETGYAFLTDSNLQVIYSKNAFDGTTSQAGSLDITEVERGEMVFNYHNNERTMKVTFRALDNGMCLATTASDIEVQGEVYMLTIEIILLTACFIVIFLYITFSVAKSIINPLTELNEAAIKVAEGDLDVNFEYEGNDEIGSLTKSLKTTVKELKKRISFTDSLAYHDSLTGLNNLTAYTRDKERLKQRFENEACDYAVFIIDINGLKMVNDTFGHRVGNDLIIESGKAIGSTFGYENVYRVGGDEFVAIIRGATEESCKVLKETLLRALTEGEGKIIPALAIGYHICHESKIEYERVFELADEAMYSEKIKLKANGITSRVIK